MYRVVVTVLLRIYLEGRVYMTRGFFFFGLPAIGAGILKTV